MDGIAMAGIHRHRRFWDSQMFWLSFFLFLGTVLGTVFFNKMSAEMKSTLESWFSGILTSSEIVSADRYSLFVGVLKKRFVWILLGIYGILRFFGLVFPQGFFYTLAAYLLWIMVVEQADGKEKIRLWMMVFFMVLGIISEIFINPNFSALIFQLF